MHPNALLDACADLLSHVLKFDHPADAVVSRYFREHKALGPRERATLAETTYDVLRRRLRYEHLAVSGAGPRPRRLAILGFAAPRDFLLSALTPPEREWLSRCDAVREEDLLAPQRHNLPDWLATRLADEQGDQFWPLAQSLLQTAPLDIRVNAQTDKRDDVRKELALAGIQAEPTPYSPWGLRIEGKPALTKLDVFTRGAIEVQDEGSQLLSLLLDARRGQMVTDFCAGAGGKTLAIGAMMRSTGRLYAFDISAHRLDALKPRLVRSKLLNVHPAAIAHERDDRIQRLAGKMDRVIVDAPCSGLGTLRRNPDLKWRQREDALPELVEKQSAILASAARMVKGGGRLVYATCSLLSQENEEVARAFGEAHPEFTPVPARSVLEQHKVPHAESLCAGVGGLFLRLWPHLHRTDGFFAAVWARRQ